MKIVELPIEGAYLFKTEKIIDHRGYFARTYDRELLIEHGLIVDFVQHSVAFNQNRSTLRGIHYQHEPFAETKMVRCVHGSIFDVILDIRPESPSFLCWHAVTLEGINLDTLYVPAGCAHGYLTMESQSLVEYMIDIPYEPSAAKGIRYDDPRFGICWPELPLVISERDKSYPNFSEEIANF